MNMKIIHGLMIMILLQKVEGVQVLFSSPWSCRVKYISYISYKIDSSHIMNFEIQIVEIKELILLGLITSIR